MLGSFKFSLCMYRQFVQSFEVIMLTYIFVLKPDKSHMQHATLIHNFLILILNYVNLLVIAFLVAWRWPGSHNVLTA